MNLKRALIVSALLHGVVVVVVSLGVNWSWQKMKPWQSLQANVVFKDKQRPKELLPKKMKALPSEKPTDVEAPKKIKEDAPPVKKEAEKAPPVKPKNEKPSTKYTNTLASLTQSFAKDLASEVSEASIEPIEDSSYFDQVYSLIKASFVVPPHLDGQKGESLMAIIRIFLARDGNLNKITLETSSGDEQFDRAVIDGTRRVNNFGDVPIFLQSVLREEGIVVELCPIKCKGE